MSKFSRSQILMLTFLAALLFATPLLSSSLRPTYLYFITNLVIIALGAEAGLLSAAFSTPLDGRDDIKIPHDGRHSSSPDPPAGKKKNRVVDKLKKCPSMPSIFFIGSGGAQVVDDGVDEGEGHGEEEEVEGISGQELFTKAETFIGNFYEQLKMQREESWKRIHGVGHLHMHSY